MLELTGQKVILKEFSKENLHDSRYFSWLRDVEVISQIYHREYLLNLDFSAVEKYVLSLLESDDNCFFAVYDKETGDFIGTQKIGHINWHSRVADMGIIIGDKNYRGKGYSKDIMHCALKYAFGALSLRRLTGGTSGTNIAMQKCFESLGFRKEGVLRSQLLINGEYADHILYGILKDEINLK
jgi:RimJ/RimL family protein N-acetyltransferase